MRRHVDPIVVKLILCWAMILSTNSVMGASSIKHAFSFDAVHESPQVEVLNYRYGDSDQAIVTPPAWALRNGKIEQGTNVNGPMPLGTMLYVKWRLKITGEVREDTVDLRQRLPADITNCRIHFAIKGQQLYVYLIYPDKRAVDAPP